MTTAAMVFGMLPLALAFGAGSEQQSPMGARGDRRDHHLDRADTRRGAGALHYFDTLGRRVKSRILRDEPAGGSAASPLSPLARR